MKKTYETPALNVETFDVEDVITASSPVSPIQNTLHQVADTFENMMNDVFDTMKDFGSGN